MSLTDFVVARREVAEPIISVGAMAAIQPSRENITTKVDLLSPRCTFILATVR
jgi:hypothetical protein